MSGTVLTEFETENVLRRNYREPLIAIASMRKSLSLNFAARNRHPIRRSRAKSAVKVIRELQALLAESAS